MKYYLSLLFLFGIHICLATPPLPDTVATANDYLVMAKQYEAAGTRDQAIEHYELAKTHYARLADHVHLIYTLDRLASLYKSDTSTQAKAEAYLDTAITLLEENLPKNDSLYALSWYTKAELKYEQRKFDEAISFYEKSLKHKQSFYGENHPEVADCFEQIGRVYLYRLQNPFASKPYLEQALKIKETLAVHDRSYINGYYHLSVTNRLRGDYDEALAYGFKALNGYQNLQESSSRYVLFAYSLLGSIYLEMDSIEKALNYNTRAIRMAHQQQLLQSIDMSLHYNNQAVYHFQAEEFDSTIYYARLAISHHSGVETLASSYQFLGNAFRSKGKLDSAFRNYQKSRALKESIYDHHHSQLATLYIDLGQAFEIRQEFDSARYYYHKALANAKISQNNAVANNDLVIQAGDDLGTLEEALVNVKDLLLKQYHQSGDLQYLEESLTYYLLLDRFIDISRTDFSSEGSKLFLSGKHKATYEQAIATSYQLYQNTPSDSLLQLIFHFMEKSKAMVLLESIHQAQRYQRALPDSLYEQEQSLRAQLAFCQSELIQVQQNSASDTDVAYWQLQKATVIRKIESINQYIQNHYPNFYNVTYRNLTIDIDSLRQQIADDQAVISYFRGDSAVYALMITPETVKVHRVNDIHSLQTAIKQYLDVLANDSVIEPSFSNYLRFQENSFALYQLLLAPLLKELPSKHLIIVPDGDLTTIPFESFISDRITTDGQSIRYENLPYLIKAYEISYEFSLSVAFWEQRFTKSFSNDHELKVAAFGIKEFDKLAGEQTYAPLGGAEREVKYIQKKFSMASIFLNAEATEKQFKQQAPEADILHIATHGIANLENPFASKFIFYPEGKEDGILNLYELYNVPLKAKVLLLSACESGVGKHYKGEGNFSLARSFVYAGSKSVVMSLWQVNDIITEQLIRSIYDQLAAQQSISESLRNTKIAFIEDGLFAHPQCWAGMVPLGNTHIEITANPYELYVKLILGLTGIGGIIYLLFRFVPKREKVKC